MTLEQCLAVENLSDKEKGIIKSIFKRKSDNKFSACADAAAVNKLLEESRKRATAKDNILKEVTNAYKSGATTEEIVTAIKNIYREKKIAALEAELANLRAGN